MLSWRFFFNQHSAQYSFQAFCSFPTSTMVETMDCGERGMSPVAMTIINPRREYWPSRGSNQRPPVLKSSMISDSASKTMQEFLKVSLLLKKNHDDCLCHERFLRTLSLSVTFILNLKVIQLLVGYTKCFSQSEVVFLSKTRKFCSLLISNVLRMVSVINLTEDKAKYYTYSRSTGFIVNRTVKVVS